MVMQFLLMRRTQVNGALQLKDREVNADNFQSKGYVILRKNLVQQEDGSYKNILTQDMINQDNTIYEIRYDFDGKTLEMPENCTLKFEGGSLNNGTIKLNYTVIDSRLSKIFSLNLIGSTPSPIYVEWFGGKYNS